MDNLPSLWLQQPLQTFASCTSSCHPPHTLIKKKSQQHPEFPSGLPSKYYPGPTLLDFSDRTRTGMFNMVWPLAKYYLKSEQITDKLCILKAPSFLLFFLPKHFVFIWHIFQSVRPDNFIQTAFLTSLAVGSWAGLKSAIGTRMLHSHGSNKNTTIAVRLSFNLTNLT